MKYSHRYYKNIMNFNISENDAKSIIGGAISATRSTMPIIPTELLITEPAATIILMPDDKKFPTIGTELPTRYCVALKNMPSNRDDAVP